MSVNRLSPTSLVAALMLMAASSVGAQTSETPPEPTRATELGVLIGGVSSAGTALVVSGVAGWEINRWTSIEARGSWFEPGRGGDGFGADLGAIVNVIARGPVTPFVGAAFGLHRAIFDSPASHMSAFYRRRVIDHARSEPLTFTDPSLRITAGIDIITARNLTIRPEASSIIIRRDGHSEAMPFVGIRFGYRFEERTVQ